MSWSSTCRGAGEEEEEEEGEGGVVEGRVGQWLTLNLVRFLSVPRGTERLSSQDRRTVEVVVEVALCAILREFMFFRRGGGGGVERDRLRIFRRVYIRWLTRIVWVVLVEKEKALVLITVSLDVHYAYSYSYEKK